jgi:tetratricopeptide (TPR) repeat protein
MIEMFTKTPLRSLVLTLFLVSLLGGVIIGQNPSRKDLKKSEQLVDQGNRALKSRNYRNAIEKFAEAVVLVPGNPAAHFGKGWAHVMLKENDAALAEFKLAEEQGYSAVEISKLRWPLYFDKNETDAAFADVSRALQADPNNQALLRAAGDLNYRKQNYNEALTSYQKASADAPNDGNVYYGIALTQQALGKYEEQEKAAAAGLSKPNQYPTELNLLLADALHKQRKYDEAIAAYNKVLAAKPDSVQIYRLMGEIYRAQSRFADAVEITRRALRQWGQNGDLYTDISWYYSLNGNTNEAIEAARSATTLLPNSYLGFTNLCRAHNDAGQFVQAVRACEGALKLNPDDGETHFYLGRALRELGRTADAAKSFDKAVTGLIKYTQVNPDYSDGFYLLGNAYFNDSQFEKALEAYQRSLALSPNFPRARYNAGVSYIRLKNKNGALEQYNALASLDKNLAERLKSEIDKM